MRRQHEKLIAGALAGLFMLGLTACETDPQALEDFDEPPELEDPAAEGEGDGL